MAGPRYEYAIVFIDALALLVIVVGTAEAFIGGLRLFFSSPSGHERRDVWLRYGRWLVAGLTFQLAADIIETSITTSWDAVGGSPRSRSSGRSSISSWNETSRRYVNGRRNPTSA